MGNYLKQMGYDEISDTFDIDKIVGTTSNQRQKISIVRDALSNLQSEQNKPVEICILKEKVSDKIEASEFDNIIEKLTRGGDIFRPSRGMIRLI